MPVTPNVKDERKQVFVLATGGTIVRSGETSVRAGYTSGQITVDKMIAAIPEIDGIANVKGEQLANVGSQDMTFAFMIQLANRINELLASDSVDGIVVTHGTDTLEETAHFLNPTLLTHPWKKVPRGS